MVLAAGFGTRLGSLTQSLPKPLVKVAGRPMLAYVLHRLRRLRPAALVINGHYHSPLLAAWLRDHGSGFRRLDFLHEPEILDTGGGIDNAASRLSGDFFITFNADVVSDIPLASAVRFHLRRQALVTMIMHDHQRYNQVEIDAGGRIINFGRRSCEAGAGKPPAGHCLRAYTGIQICSPRLLSLLRRRRPGPFSLIDFYASLLATGRADLHSFEVDTQSDFYWRDLGRPEDLRALEADLGGRPELAARLGAG